MTNQTTEKLLEMMEEERVILHHFGTGSTDRPAVSLSFRCPSLEGIGHRRSFLVRQAVFRILPDSLSLLPGTGLSSPGASLKWYRRPVRHPVPARQSSLPVPVACPGVCPGAPISRILSQLSFRPLHSPAFPRSCSHWRYV